MKLLRVSTSNECRHFLGLKVKGTASLLVWQPKNCCQVCICCVKVGIDNCVDKTSKMRNVSSKYVKCVVREIRLK